MKDAEALQSYLQSEVKPGNNKHSSKSPAGVLRLLKVLSLKRSGCENLPPSSQGDETPCTCTSNSSSSDGSVTAEEPQLQRQASGDVCSSAADVSAGCSSRKETAAINDVRSTHVDAAAATPANTASSCTEACPLKPPAAQHVKPKLRLLSFCSEQAQLIHSKLRPARRTAAASNNSPAKAPRPALYRRASLLLPAKGPKATMQHGGSLQPLVLNSRPTATRPQQQRAASLFEATGRENIRYLLGPHAVWGSISRFKMLLLAEQVHESHLQTVLNQTVEQTDWAGEPAWEDSFSVINSKYAQRVRQHLFWWGGALAHLRWQGGSEEECRAEEAAAQVAVVLSGEVGGAADSKLA